MIFLTGFMGSGKTTLGRGLASRLGVPFVDLDEAVEERTGRPVPDIFRCAGEEAFRIIERKALLDVAARNEPCVAATGGGAPVSSENRKVMKACGSIVYLRASFDTVSKRIAGDGTRPLWGPDANKLFETRKAAYEDADLIIDTDGKTPGRTLEEILERLPPLPSPTGVILPDNPYPVYIGNGIFDDILSLMKRHREPEGLFALVDENVLKHHKARIERALAPCAHAVMPVPPGEGSKSPAFLNLVLKEMFSRRVNRSWVLLAVGGGVTGDLGGFAASMYMRGIPVVQTASTLLAQVDSGIGGKTGVNNEFGKNLVGTFHQPLFVLSDAGFLGTLGEERLRDAMSEVVKYGIIMDLPLFELVESGPPFDYERIVSLCSRDKASVVSRDEREGGLRRILNFGHTLAHAVETCSGYTVTHGSAVALGMLFASRLSHGRGMLSSRDLERIEAVIRRDLSLPSAPLPAPEDAMAVFVSDKKGAKGGVHFVLTPGIGSVSVQKLSDIEILEAYRGFADGYAQGL